MKILPTTTFYQDCPGDHHAPLESTGLETVCERNREEHSGQFLSGRESYYSCRARIHALAGLE